MPLFSTLKARKKFKTRLIFGLALKPLRLFCAHCGKYVPSDREWFCGYCDRKNERTKLYSFLRKCQHCKRFPKAYICPHSGCEHLNFLDKIEDIRHPACFFEGQKAAATQAGSKERGSKINEEPNASENAKLDSELADFKKSETCKQLLKRQEREKELSEFMDGHLGDQLFVEEKIREYERDYKDNPIMLAKLKMVLKEWAEIRIRKRA